MSNSLFKFSPKLYKKFYESFADIQQFTKIYIFFIFLFYLLFSSNILAMEYDDLNLKVVACYPRGVNNDFRVREVCLSENEKEFNDGNFYKLLRRENGFYKSKGDGTYLDGFYTDNTNALKCTYAKMIFENSLERTQEWGNIFGQQNEVKVITLFDRSTVIHFEDRKKSLISNAIAWRSNEGVIITYGVHKTPFGEQYGVGISCPLNCSIL